MKRTRVLVAQLVCLYVPFPVLLLTVGAGSPIAILITFSVPVLVMALVVGWELKRCGKEV